MQYESFRGAHLARLDGKVAVITGANSGIGFEAARGLLAQGAAVLLACRNPRRALAARETLLKEFGGALVAVSIVDLASNASIDAFARDLAQRYEKIDIFLHCAGVYYPRGSRTEDGYPMTVGVNYLGTRRLCEAVLPLMEAGGRMIFTTSLVDRFGRVSKAGEAAHDLGREGFAAYARSKHLLSAYACRRAGTRAPHEPSFIAVHPGITATSLLSAEKTTHKPLFSRLGHAFLYRFTHSPEKAALTALLAAAGDVTNGDCIGPRGLFGISGYPKKTRYCPSVRRRAAASAAPQEPTPEA